MEICILNETQREKTSGAIHYRNLEKLNLDCFCLIFLITEAMKFYKFYCLILKRADIQTR